LLLSSEAERYGGERRGAFSGADLLPWECAVFGPASWRTFD
jgi:hypothetical protein